MTTVLGIVVALIIGAFLGSWGTLVFVGRNWDAVANRINSARPRQGEPSGATTPETTLAITRPANGTEPTP